MYEMHILRQRGTPSASQQTCLNAETFLLNYCQFCKSFKLNVQFSSGHLDIEFNQNLSMYGKFKDKM